MHYFTDPPTVLKVITEQLHLPPPPSQLKTAWHKSESTAQDDDAEWEETQKQWSANKIRLFSILKVIMGF